MYAPGTNNGHGHVWKRPDGIRMRCGGPRLCRVCAQDASDKNESERTPLKKWLTNVTQYIEDSK